jgi:hypothetical protein
LDHHRIIELLRRIYPGKWISTGKSKGGMAALFLEHYYPDDIDATVAFVAPIFDGIKDKRFIPYLNQISGEKERKRIKEFQIDCLERRDSMKSYIQRYLENNRLKYSMSLDSILEWSVIEFPYSFWSGNSDPEKIPDLSSATLKIFNYLNSISIISNFGDSYIKSNYPLLWQVTTEFGYYAYDIKHLDSLLKVITEPDNICFAPASVIAPNFSPEEMQKVLYDLKFSCSNIIYLYGENDIWTAASVNPELTTNSIQIVVKGYAHDFNIVDLAPDDSELVMSTLKSWIQE